jgi:glycosyltransferase involved in cell wall biosynthesis
MKILMVTFGFYPAIAWGGPTTVVYQNALELQRRGHRVTVIASNRLSKQQCIAPGCFEREQDGIRVVYLHTYMLKNWPGTTGPTLISPAGLIKLRQEIRRADIVHINSTRNIFSLAAARFAAWQNKPYVLQPHGTLPRIVSSIRLKQLFDRFFLGLIIDKAKTLIALQPAEVQQIIRAGGDSARTVTVSNGLSPITNVPAAKQKMFRSKFGIASDERLILFLARINRKKGTDLLIEAFAQMPAALRQQAKLIIAGPDDGQLAQVQALVKQYCLEDRVVFTGLLAGEEVDIVHAAAELFVLPCRVDTFPMAILEACRAGTPMVVTETCEIAGMLKDEVATIVSVEPAAIAQGMSEVLQNGNLRQCYQKGAQKLMQTAFSIEAVGQQLEEIYIHAMQDSHTNYASTPSPNPLENH